MENSRNFSEFRMTMVLHMPILSTRSMSWYPATEPAIKVRDDHPLSVVTVFVPKFKSCRTGWGLSYFFPEADSVKNILASRQPSCTSIVPANRNKIGFAPFKRAMLTAYALNRIENSIKRQFYRRYKICRNNTNIIPWFRPISSAIYSIMSGNRAMI